ncbi:serine protease snake-like [Anopheles aquasalis]|uniref:serine protease snake-like n=1 Tax=Anopheles aquasalis TaxID=42839 RepID=UPI00215AE517|nr:serine protease snake-like [Anopheles aquasalis]
MKMQYLISCASVLLLLCGLSEGQRLAEQKCIEYRRSPEQCPITPHTLVGSVDQREFPHYVAIEDPAENTKYEFLCGGALISEQYVLTTASCITEELVNSVRLGAVHDLRETNGVRKEIESFVRHPKYSRALAYHDIALIRLNEPVQFSDTIRPICLSEGLTGQGELILHGFGRESYLDDLSPQMTKRVQPPLMARSDCDDVLLLHATRRLRNGLAKEQFCIDSSNEAACATSVADLLVKKDDHNDGCNYFLEGIGSAGYPCGAENSVGVYTNVTQYLDWIETIVWSGA